MTTSRAPDSIGPAAGRRKSRHRPHWDSVLSLDEHVLLTTREAAALTTYTPHGLENLRSAGRGPAFIKMRGGAVAYRLSDLIAWQEAHRVATLEQS